MMAKAVTVARWPDAVQPDADATYRRLFDSFNPDSGGQISPLEVLLGYHLCYGTFPALTSDIDRMYTELLQVRSGGVADYIPQLKRVDPDQLAIALCAVDGQRFSVGDEASAFCLQSVSKTVSYCLTLDERGTEAARLCGGRRPGFNNAVYLSERQTADRNFALGYSMRESGAFRPGTELLREHAHEVATLPHRPHRSDKREAAVG